MWTGADAADRGLVDLLGGFATALGEAKRLGGLAPDDVVALATFPKSSLLERFRPKESSEPPAARLLAWLAWAVLAGVDELERRGATTGAQAILPGDHRIR